MARLRTTAPKSGKRILLVDDQQDYLTSTATLIAREGHDVLTATSGSQALDLLRAEHVDLVLLDYYMPGGMTGEDVVRELRTFNTFVQVILQTGYAGEYPAREMLQRLDIQGYHDKSDGPDRLILWVDAGLKVAYMVQLLYKSRQALRYILDATPEMHRIKPLDDLLQGILLSISGLAGAVNSFVALAPQWKARNESDEPPPDAFLAVVDDEMDLAIHVATGRFASKPKLTECLDDTRLKAIQQIMAKEEKLIVDEFAVVPLAVGDVTLGVIFLDQSVVQKEDVELLQIFANQAAVAIHNTRLYEMATIDTLTGVYVRRYFDKWLMREVRSMLRSNEPMSVLMIDLDGLKAINDAAGHHAGDQALAMFGAALRNTTRLLDLAARYGGDEFVVALPQTPLQNAHLVGQRILDNIAGRVIEGPGCRFPLSASIGIAGLGSHDIAPADIPRPITRHYLEAMCEQLVNAADTALYEAKKDPHASMRIGRNIDWMPFTMATPSRG
jgi:two-component system, cell cycle response regulator